MYLEGPWGTLNVELLALKVRQALQRDGFRATLRKSLADLLRLTRGAGPDEFDRRHGTDTGRSEPLWKFHVPSPNARFGIRYEASDEEDLIEAIGLLPENPRDFTFIDLGCGKGRTLLVASALGFRQVVGVDFVAELVEIARANLAKMGVANADVLYGDAADFDFPDGGLVVYLGNPFTQEVMRRVIAHLQKAGGRPLYVIYKVPKCSDVLDASGFLTRFGHVPKRYIRIWRASAPADAGASAPRTHL
jgi:SAM-dependent methyltransferase